MSNKGFRVFFNSIKKISIIVSIMLSFSVCYFGSISAQALEITRTVKVAFFPMPGYHTKTSDGLYTGMEVDYFNALSRYIKWNVEYVDCVSWQEAMRMLDSGQVDLVGTAQYSAERAAKYTYAKLASGYTFGGLLVLNDSDIAYEDFQLMGAMRFGVSSSWIRKQDFIDYLHQNGIANPNITEYLNTTELDNALANHEIDVIAKSFLETKDGQRLVGRFSDAEYFYITTPDKDNIMDELNQGIADLKMNEPYFENKLMKVYYGKYMENKTIFSMAEQNFLNKLGKVKVGYFDGYYPFSNEDDANNKAPAGVGVVQMEKFSEITGVPVEYEFFGSYMACQTALLNGEIDVMAYFVEPAASENLDIELAAIYNVSQLAEIVAKDKEITEIETIAMTPSIAETLTFSGNMPDAQMVESQGDMDSIFMVENNMADGAIVNSYVVSSDINSNKIQARMGMIYHETQSVGIGVAKSANPYLKSTIEKCVTAYDEEEINVYILEHGSQQQYGFSNWLKENGLTIGMIIMFIILAAVSIFAFFIFEELKIQRLLYKDAELDIWNANYFYYWADRILQKRASEGYAIVELNIVKFRLYGNFYGWNGSNRLFKIMSEAIASNIENGSNVGIFGKLNVNRYEELFARYQSDRFVMMLKGKPYDLQFDSRLKKLIKGVENRLFYETGMQMRINAGVYFVKEDDNDIKNSCLNATQALDNLSKMNSEGKSSEQICYYDVQLSRVLEDQRVQEEIFDGADVEMDFVPFYQSKVDINTGKIVGAEALVRYVDPNIEGKIVAPFFFVPYYEKTGKIIELDLAVLDKVCRFIRRRLDEQKPIVPISVNFSRRHLVNREFPEQVREIIDAYGVPVDLIEAEITESVLVDEMQQDMMYDIIRELHDLGIKILIDDFGSGYSSLGAIERIPVSILKMDRSFMINHTDAKRQETIMREVVAMARGLDAEVICEGVETDEDVEMLKRIGADIAQGFRYSRPTPEAEFVIQLESN